MHGIETVIETREREIVDGFKVRRALPSARRRMVGPFIFLDQMGPEKLAEGAGLNVAPHPHIGLATVTYLFEGELLHRDGLGTVQMILPGEVNWMTAGSGIAHSERSPPEEVLNANARLFGIQAWVALPSRDEEKAPKFAHHGQDTLPLVEGEGKHVRLICGSLYEARSPVRTLSDMFYADVLLDAGARLPMPTAYEERAVFVIEGSIEASGSGRSFGAGQLVAFTPKEEITLKAGGSSVRIMLLGGEPLDGKRHIWWNFVASSAERIEQAKDDWRNGRFAPVPDETEFIPLPETGPAVVRYP